MLDRDDNYQLISGVFNSEKDVHDALDSLHTRGLTDRDISVMMSDKTRDRYPSLQHEGLKEGNKLPEGASAGGLAGGLLGALIGGLAVTGSVLLPGVGLLVAGPLLGALTGIGIGSATGGLVGALVGAGIPEEEARTYEHAVKQEGNIVLMARAPRAEASDVRVIFERYGAHSLQTR